MANVLSASSISPHALSEAKVVSGAGTHYTYPGSTTFAQFFPGLTVGTGALAETAITSRAGLFPGPTDFPGSTDFPGKGSALTAKAA